MSSFIITGHGRSGTMFLARELSKSPTWEVRHEPTAEMDKRAIQRRFERHEGLGQNYGEVNSFLLYCFRDVGVDRLAVIIRDPLEIATSMANKGHPVTATFCDHLAASCALIDAAIGPGVKVISFRSMTTTISGLQTAADAVGITDLPRDRLCLDAANESSKTFRFFADLSRPDQGAIERSVRWFREKYGSLWE